MHGNRMVVLAGIALAFWSALIGPRAVTAAPSNTQAAASAPVAAPPPASQPASAATDFDGRLREVEAAEADTDFAKAIRLCQAMITDFKTGDQLKTLGEALRRLTDGKKTASKLAFAVQKLAASDVQARQAGVQVLEDEGDLGVIFLRHAFRTKEEPIAREAGRMLAQQGDTNSIPLFLDKIRADPRSPLAEVASQGLVFMVQNLDKSVVASCFGLVQSDKGFVMARAVDVLEAVFIREFKRDEKAFNEAAGHPDAANVLRDYFSAALLSTNPAVVAWACERMRDVLPMRDGFRARYYTNTDFKGVAVDRLVPGVRFDLDRSLLTGGRSNDISVRWTSDLLVRQAGDHTVGVQATRDLPRTVRLWVDDKLVLELPPGVPDVGTAVTLETGWHKLRIDYVKQTGGINAGDISFTWAGPKVEGAQGAQVAQSQAVAFMHGPWPEELAAMAKAATDLGAKNYPVVKAARQRLAAAASLGRVFLFNVIGKQAGAARRQATDGLSDQVRQIESRRFPALYNRAMAAEAEPVNPSIAILCAALWQNCDSAPEPFNALVGAPDGYAKLKAHVEAALVSNDKAVVARACRDGSPFAPALPGLYGRYFADPDFSQLTTERLDAKIEAGKPQYPVPPDRQGRVSAEWSGWLVVDKTTTNTFQPDARGQSAGFSVEGISVGGNTAMRLAAGRHACRVEFRQGDTNAESWIRFYWDVPGAGRRPVGPFNCAPWDSRLDALGRSAADLASGDTMRIRSAREVLRDSAGVGLLHLRNAIRYGTAPEATAAATFLGGTQDKDAPPLLLARLKQEKDAAAIAALTDALGELVGVIDPKAFPEMFREALADGAGEMNPYASTLCAALWRTCGSDAKKFGGLVGNPEGHAKLDAHVKAALTSKDLAAMARACRTGYPFAPLLPGLRGRYFDDPEFLKLAQDRLDGRLEVGNRQFPLPTNRQDNISVEWSGVFSVAQAGDFTFFAGAENYAGVYVDERQVNPGNWMQPAKVPLAPGLHTFRTVFVQNQPGRNSSVSVSWEGPGVGRQAVSAGLFQCAPWDGKLAELGKAVADLAAVDPAKAGGARETLVNAGEVGRVYLRNAIRHGMGPEVVAAVALLTEYGDKPSVALMLARFAGEKEASLTAALEGGICAMAGEIDSKTLTEFVRTALAPDAAAMNPRIRILCAALVACGGSPEAFNKLVNTPNGYASLQKHVQTALASASPETVRLACRYGAPFAPALPGFIGRYYRGQDFRDLALEKLDPQVNIPNRQFPYPDKRQDNISARWTGLLRIEKPGDYTFIVNAQGGANVWVDDRHVAASAQWGEQKKDAVKLNPGLHKVRVETWQASGNNQVQLQWVPSGGTRDWIPSGLIVSAPAEAVLAQVEKAVAGLSSAKPEEVGAAAEVLTRHGALSLFFLGRAVRTASPAGVAAYVPPMVAMGDLSMTNLLRDLRKTQPPLAAAMDAAIQALVAKPDRRYAPWFYAVMKADGALEFPVSGKFLSKALQEVCGNKEVRFNGEFAGGDAQGAANLKAYLGKLPKENKP